MQGVKDEPLVLRINDIDVALFSYRLMGFIINSIGLYLLKAVYHGERDKTQHLYLANLAVTNALVLFLEMFIYFIIPYCYNLHNRADLNKFEEYTLVVRLATSGILHYGTMCVIMAHRFFTVLFCYRYPLFWGVTETKRLLKAMWASAAIVSGIACVIFRFKNFDIRKVYYFYVFLFLDCVYLIILFTCYGFIFFSQLKRMMEQRSRSRANSNNSLFKALGRRRFAYIPLLLLLNFIFLTMTTDLLWFVAMKLKEKELGHKEKFPDKHIIESLTGKFATFTSVTSHIVDMAIYIFVHPSVRRLLIEKLINCYRCMNLNSKVGSSATGDERSISTVCNNGGRGAEVGDVVLETSA